VTPEGPARVELCADCDEELAGNPQGLVELMTRRAADRAGGSPGR